MWADLRRGVYSPLAPLGETEVLDRIGDVNVLPGHLSFTQRILQQPSSRTDKRNTLAVFDVAGLFSDESQRCLWVARREHHLGCGLPKLTAAAVLCRPLELLDVGVLGHPGCRRLRHLPSDHPRSSQPTCRVRCAVLPPFELDHVQYGVDQRQVSEGLREVAQLLAGVRIDLFAVQIEFTCE